MSGKGPTVDEVLEDERVNRELKLKLGYAQRELARGDRDPRDISLLTEVRRTLMREAARRRDRP